MSNGVSKQAASLTYTKGFATDNSWLDHWQHHRREFNFRDEYEYLVYADEFLGGDKLRTVEECYRKDGDLVRYNTSTGEFGVLRKDGYIRTYHKLINRIHGYPSGLSKFYAECNK